MLDLATIRERNKGQPEGYWKTTTAALCDEVERLSKEHIEGAFIMTGVEQDQARLLAAQAPEEIAEFIYYGHSVLHGPHASGGVEYRNTAAVAESFAHVLRLERMGNELKQLRQPPVSFSDLDNIRRMLDDGVPVPPWLVRGLIDRLSAP